MFPDFSITDNLSLVIFSASKNTRFFNWILYHLIERAMWQEQYASYIWKQAMFFALSWRFYYLHGLCSSSRMNVFSLTSFFEYFESSLGENFTSALSQLIVIAKMCQKSNESTRHSGHQTLDLLLGISSHLNSVFLSAKFIKIIWSLSITCGFRTVKTWRYCKQTWASQWSSYLLLFCR